MVIQGVPENCDNDELCPGDRVVLGRETTPDPDTSAIMSSSSSSSTAGDTGTSLPEEVIQRFRGQSREVSACNQILFNLHPHPLVHLAKILKT